MAFPWITDGAQSFDFQTTLALVAGNVYYVAAPADLAPASVSALIQTQLDAASPGDVVRLAAGSIYECGIVGTTTFASTSPTLYNYCIKIPTGVRLDLNGSRLRFAASVAGDDAVLIAGATGAVDIGIIGRGTLDGNDAAITDGALVWFDSIAGIELDVKLENVVRLGLYLPGSSRIVAPRIIVDGAAGAPVDFGSPTAGSVSDSWVGYLEVRNTTAWTPNTFNFPGNPFIGSLSNVHVDVLIAIDNAAGIKVDVNGGDATFGFVYGRGCTTVNSGFKFQGTGGGTPLRGHIDHLHMEDQAGEGLYLEQEYGCSIGTYTGNNNATLNITGDLRIGGTRVTIGEAHISGAGGSSVEIRDAAVDYRIGILTIYNPAVVANGVSDEGGQGTIDHLLAVDDRGGSSKMDRGYRSTSANSVCRIDHAEIRGATFAPIQRTAGDKVSINRLRVDATADLDVQTVATDADFTLTPGSSAQQTFHTGVLTAARAVTLSTTGVTTSLTFRITRTGGGAFNLNVGGGPLKALATNTWADFTYDGAAWKLAAYGAL